MALSKLRSESIDLTDDFAFTGTVTGAGSNSGFRFIKKVNISTTSAVQDFTNLFSADYNFYKLIFDITGDDTSDTDTSHSFQYLKASDGTVDTTADIDYAFRGIDSSNASRNMGASRNNRSHFNFMLNTVQDDHRANYEFGIYNPFNALHTVVQANGAYSVNSGTDATSFHGCAIRHNTTSYSGMRLIIVADSNTSTTPDVSASATGTLLVYGMAES